MISKWSISDWFLGISGLWDAWKLQKTNQHTRKPLIRYPKRENWTTVAWFRHLQSTPMKLFNIILSNGNPVVESKSYTTAWVGPKWKKLTLQNTWNWNKHETVLALLATNILATAFSLNVRNSARVAHFQLPCISIFSLLGMLLTSLQQFFYLNIKNSARVAGFQLPRSRIFSPR